MPTKRNRFLPRLRSEVEAEVRMVQASYLPEADGESSANWMFDPVDVQREWVGLHTLLDAVDITETEPLLDYTPESE